MKVKIMPSTNSCCDGGEVGDVIVTAVAAEQK